MLQYEYVVSALSKTCLDLWQCVFLLFVILRTFIRNCCIYFVSRAKQSNTSIVFNFMRVSFFVYDTFSPIAGKTFSPLIVSINLRFAFSPQNFHASDGILSSPGAF